MIRLITAMTEKGLQTSGRAVYEQGFNDIFRVEIGSSRWDETDLSTMEAVKTPIIGANVFIRDNYNGVGEIFDPVTGQSKTVKGRYVVVAVDNRNITAPVYVREIALFSRFKANELTSDNQAEIPILFAAATTPDGQDINNLLPVPEQLGVHSGVMNFECFLYLTDAENVHLIITFDSSGWVTRPTVEAMIKEHDKSHLAHPDMRGRLAYIQDQIDYIMDRLDKLGATPPPVKPPEEKEEFLTLADERERWGIIADDDGRIWLGGGMVRTSGNPLSMRVDRYTKDGVLQSVTSLSHQRHYPSTVKDSGGSLWFIGSGSIMSGSPSAYTVIERYTQTGVKSTLTAPRRFEDSTAAIDSNGQVWVGGGNTGTSGMSSTFDEVHTYTSSGVWVTRPKLSFPRHALAADTDGNGNVWFFGGRGFVTAMLEEGGFRNVDRYTSDGVHTIMPQLSAGKFRAATASDADGNIWVGGGSNGYGDLAHFNAVNRYSLGGVRTVMAPLSAKIPSLSTLSTDRNAAVVDKSGDVLFAYPVCADASPQYHNALTIDRYNKDGVLTTTIITDLKPHPINMSVNWDVTGTIDGNGDPWFALPGQAVILTEK